MAPYNPVVSAANSDAVLAWPASRFVRTLDTPAGVSRRKDPASRLQPRQRQPDVWPARIQSLPIPPESLESLPGHLLDPDIRLHRKEDSGRGHRSCTSGLLVRMRKDRE